MNFTLLNTIIFVLTWLGRKECIAVSANNTNDSNDDSSSSGQLRHHHNRRLQSDIEITNFTPNDSSFVSASTYELGVEVSLPSSTAGIRNVRFQTRSPTGQTSSFLDGNSDDADTTTNGSGYYTSGPIDINAAGRWQWRVEAEDTSQPRNRITSEWMELHNINEGNGPAFILNMIRNDIVDLIRFRGGPPNNNNNNNNDGTIDLRPKILRLGFHDCVGSCDGCIDLENDDNKGLEIPIAALAPIVDKYVNVPAIDALLLGSSKISRADIWALATLTAADEAESQTDLGTFPMTHIGRIDCEDTGASCHDRDGTIVPCEATRGPHRDLPGPDLDTHQLLQFFSDHFGFNPREVVAIMGAHTIGTLSRTNSGFDGPRGWVNNNRALDNNYYAQLVGGNAPTTNENVLRHAPSWTIEHIDNSNVQTNDGGSVPSRYQWFHSRPGPNNNNNDIVMLNSDMALVRDLSSDNEDNNNQYLDSETGEVDGCQFRCGGRNAEVEGCPTRNPPACPLARMTLNIAAEYKFDNELWIQDFESVLIKMLKNGYNYDDDDTTDNNEECQSAPCILTPTTRTTDDEGSPTNRPTAPPTPPPTPQAIAPTPLPIFCKTTEHKFVYFNGKEKMCTGLLNRFVAPPGNPTGLEEACKESWPTTDPNNNGDVLVSDACPTFCNQDRCCPIDEGVVFLVPGKENKPFKKKMCGGLLNNLLEDQTALAEQCDAVLPTVSGAEVLVKEACTGLCDNNCPKEIACEDKLGFSLTVTDDKTGTSSQKTCKEFFKNTWSKDEIKTVCKVNHPISNDRDPDNIKTIFQPPKKICPLQCTNLCKNVKAAKELNGEVLFSDP